MDMWLKVANDVVGDLDGNG